MRVISEGDDVPRETHSRGQISQDSKHQGISWVWKGENHHKQAGVIPNSCRGTENVLPVSHINENTSTFLAYKKWTITLNNF